MLVAKAVTSHLDAASAGRARDAVARALYANLFARVVALVNTGSGRPFTRRHEQALAAVCFEIEQARARLVASRRVRSGCSPAGSTRLWRRVVCVSVFSFSSWDGVGDV